MTAWHRRLLPALLLATLPAASSAMQPATTPESPFSDAELEYLQDAIARRMLIREIDPRITAGLGLSAREAAGRRLRGSGTGDPSNGVVYYWIPIPDGRIILGRREWHGATDYWLLVSSRFALERAMVRIQDEPVPLPEALARRELNRAIAFFRSQVPVVICSGEAQDCRRVRQSRH